MTMSLNDYVEIQAQLYMAIHMGFQRKSKDLFLSVFIYFILFFFFYYFFFCSLLSFTETVTSSFHLPGTDIRDFC